MKISTYSAALKISLIVKELSLEQNSDSWYAANQNPIHQALPSPKLLAIPPMIVFIILPKQEITINQFILCH